MLRLGDLLRSAGIEASAKRAKRAKHGSAKHALRDAEARLALAPRVPEAEALFVPDENAGMLIRADRILVSKNGKPVSYSRLVPRSRRVEKAARKEARLQEMQEPRVVNKKSWKPLPTLRESGRPIDVHTLQHGREIEKIEDEGSESGKEPAGGFLPGFPLQPMRSRYAEAKASEKRIVAQLEARPTPVDVAAKRRAERRAKLVG